MDSDLDILKYNEKFGVITNKLVLIKLKDKQRKVNYEEIKNVKLVKYRVFYSNIALLVSSLIFIAIGILSENLNSSAKIFIGSASLLLLFYSFLHKFYFYKLEININPDDQVVVITNQSNKSSIKDFYFSILKRVKRESTSNSKIISMQSA